MSDKIDLRISGASTMPGGDYGTVSISGIGKIEGNLRAETMKCSGSAKVNGNVTAQHISCSGKSSLHGTVTAQSIRISGVLKAEGEVQTEELSVSGCAKLERSCRCRLLKVAGTLTSDKDVEAEEAYLSGAVKIEGLLNAEKIQMTADCLSKINEIGCSELVVRREDRGLLNRLLTRCTGNVVQVNSIEADRVDITDTHADLVRGRDVTIGQGCKIRRVEYSGSCHAQEGTVEELVKL